MKTFFAISIVKCVILGCLSEDEIIGNPVLRINDGAIRGATARTGEGKFR